MPRQQGCLHQGIVVDVDDIAIGIIVMMFVDEALLLADGIPPSGFTGQGIN
jgi:hypothetical protein